MFNFDTIVVVGDETCAYLISDGVSYMISACNGSVVCTAATENSYRVTCQMADGSSSDIVYLRG